MSKSTDMQRNLSADLRLQAVKKLLTAEKCLPVIVIGVNMINNDAVCQLYNLDEALTKNDLLELIEAAKQIILKQNG